MAEPDGKTSTTISERMNMARAYDSLNAPDPDDWQSMGEEERMMLVIRTARGRRWYPSTVKNLLERSGARVE